MVDNSTQRMEIVWSDPKQEKNLNDGNSAYEEIVAPLNLSLKGCLKGIKSVTLSLSKCEQI